MPDARTLGEFTDYEGLLAAIRNRVRELEIAGEPFDEFAGLPKGYLSKLVGSRPTRRIAHVSMGPLLAGLGVVCRMIEDPAATARLKQRLRPRNSSFVRSAPSIVFTVRFFKRIGRKGAQARIDNSTERQRRKWAKKAAAARWKNGNP